jgi:hypothetical protein
MKIIIYIIFSLAHFKRKLSFNKTKTKVEKKFEINY